MGRPSKATPSSITLPRAFVLEVLTRHAVPVLQDEAANEALIEYSVDAGAARCRTPEDALRALLGFWLAGYRPEDQP